MSLINISMRLDYLFQRIGPIDDRFQFSLFNQLFEEDQIFSL